jgi:hypothetical protein
MDTAVEAEDHHAGASPGGESPLEGSSEDLAALERGGGKRAFLAFFLLRGGGGCGQ